MKFTDHSTMVKSLRTAQASQRDMRDSVKEAQLFINKRDGQWEQSIIHRMRGKPRYTDDRVNPIVNQIAGELSNAEFSLKIRPAGGQSTQQLALLKDGLIRNIRNMSNADRIFSQAGRKAVEGGFAAWLITHDYYDNDSFDQDLLIEPLHDAHERVWLDPDDLSNDGSDAKWGVVLHYIGKDEYQRLFPEGKMQSIGGYSWDNAYYYKPEFVTVAHVYYLETVDETLMQMSDGRVFKQSETPNEILDDLAQAGINIEDTRKVKRNVCKVRIMDAGGWLNEAEDTVFDSIPIIPVYANFSVLEGKIIYRGVVEKLMDMQRVHNYALSRNVEEVALSPRKKIFMTPEQAEGFEEQIRTMNTNMEPVQFYNAVGNVPPPFEGGASQPNQAVSLLTEQSDQAISKAAGMFAANMGANTKLQSGVAIERQIDRGNNGTSAYFDALAVAMTRTGRVLLKAIPIVYDATRQVRILKEDGMVEQVLINEVVIDQQTGQQYTLNDLTQGKYDVVCDIGAAYKNRQQEASEMFMRAMEVDPNLIGIAGDIWVRNINAVGFDQIAERLRARALAEGIIPKEQMTAEEQQHMDAMSQQGDTPSAEQIQLQIAQQQAQTAMMAEQNKATEHQLKMAELQMRQVGADKKIQSKLAVDSAKIDQTQQRIDLEAAKVQMQQQQQQFDRMIQMQQTQVDQLNTLTQALLNVKNAIGGDVIVNNESAQAYNNIAQDINEL